jgi:hypothetical protein
MATLASTSINVAGAFTPTLLALGASDTFTYVANANSMLVFYNKTASPVVVTVDGDGGTTVSVPGTGTTLSVASGVAITVPANAFKAVRLDSISAYLQGVIAMTGGTGVDACLLG